MTKSELSKATKMAQEGNAGILETDKFLGFGLTNFQPVTVTLKELAQLVAWQCVQLNGEIDGDALNEIARHGRHRFQIVGLGVED